MASQHRAVAPHGAPKRDALAVGRRVAIGALVVAIVVLGVFVVIQKTKTPSHASPASPKIAGPGQKLPVGQRALALVSLTKVAADMHLATKSTFKLTYSAYNVPGAPSLILLEQMPPDRLFDAHSSEVIVKGKDTYYCKVLPAASCDIAHSAATTPLGQLIEVYNPPSYLATINTLRKLIRSGLVDHFSSSTATFAGQPSDCASWGYAYSVVTYCVTKTGVLAYFTISGVNASRTASIVTLSTRLVSYSTKVGPADFVLPHAAKIASHKAS
jgi:hypothetical protein